MTRLFRYLLTILLFLTPFAKSHASDPVKPQRSLCDEKVPDELRSNLPERRLCIAWYPWSPYQHDAPATDIVTSDTVPHGLDIDLVRTIFRDAQYQVDYVRMDSWAENQDALRAGGVDALAGAFPTKEREAYTEFTDIYRYESNRFYVDDSSPLARETTETGILAAIAQGRSRLGVVAGYNYTSDTLNRWIRKHPERVVASDSEGQNFDRLINGDVDILVSDEFVAENQIWSRHRAANERDNDELAKQTMRIQALDIDLNPKGLIVLLGKTSPRLQLLGINSVQADFDRSLGRMTASGQIERIHRNSTFPIMLAMTIESNWFRAVDILGTLVFAISGLIVARRSGCDVFGALMISGCAALGGGIIRDTVVGRDVAAIKDPLNLEIVLAITAIATVLSIATRKRTLESTSALTGASWQWLKRKANDTREIFDAVGLGAYIVIGVVVAVEQQLDPLPLWGAVFATITSVGGTMLHALIRADAENPMIKGELYAEIALLWGLAFSYYLTWQAEQRDPEMIQWAVVVTIVGAFLTRMTTYFLKTRSPLI